MLQELRSVMGEQWVDQLEDRAPTSDELGKLKYLNVVLKEVCARQLGLGWVQQAVAAGRV